MENITPEPIVPKQPGKGNDLLIIMINIALQLGAFLFFFFFYLKLY